MSASEAWSPKRNGALALGDDQTSDAAVGFRDIVRPWGCAPLQGRKMGPKAQAPSQEDGRAERPSMESFPHRASLNSE